jgi:pimeloyl-ACP methyl ester carboxylesterase
MAKGNEPKAISDMSRMTEQSISDEQVSRESPWRRLYPFESNFWSLGEHRLHYLDEGHGEPLLMVHGNPTWSFYWRNLVLAFRDQYRTVVPDHIGCGLSDKPQHYPYSLSQHIENLTNLVEHLDLSDITLLVHDWGGAIGLGTALAMPERFKRLIVFNTGAFPPPFIPFRIRICRTPILGTLAMRGLNVFARAALTMATEKPERMTDDVRSGFLAPYDNWSHRIAVQRFVQDIPASASQPTWQRLADIEQRLPTLADRPVQMIWGMRDWCFTPECLERLSKSLPGAEVHRFADAGHYVVEDAHERIVPIVRDFLNAS